MRLDQINTRLAGSFDTFQAAAPAVTWMTPEIHHELLGANADDFGEVLSRLRAVGVDDLAMVRCELEAITLENVLGIVDHSRVKAGQQAVEGHASDAVHLAQGRPGEVVATKDGERYFNAVLYKQILEHETWAVPIVLCRDRDGRLHLIEGHHRLGYLVGLHRAGKTVATTHQAYVLQPRLPRPPAPP